MLATDDNDDSDCQGPHEQCGHNQGQDQAQSSSNSNSNTVDGSNEVTVATSVGDNFQSLNFSSPDDIKIRNVVNPGTPNSYPTSPCRIAVSGGFSFPGAALSGGGSVEDEECTLRETARAFRDLGVPEMGLYLLCQSSDTIIGKRDKKGELEKYEPSPLGAAECMRLVGEFQGDPDGDNAQRDAAAEQRFQHELLLLGERQDNFESSVNATIAQLVSQQRTTRRAVATQSQLQAPDPELFSPEQKQELRDLYEVEEN